MEEGRPRAGLIDYAGVIARQDESGLPFVIVGGQAVNYWAEHYAAREPRLDLFRPFTSKDLDLLASTDQTRELAKSLASDGWAFNPPEEGADVVQGSLHRGDLLVELMRPVHRPTSEPLNVFYNVGLEDLPLRVSHPLELLRSKMDLAVFIPQDGSVPEIAPRRDVAHVQMLALIMPHHLADLAAQYPSPRNAPPPFRERLVHCRVWCATGRRDGLRTATPAC